MNYSCANVSFRGEVDESVYKWAKIANKEAIEAKYHDSDCRNIALKQEDIDAINKQTADMLELLEQKAKVMHPDTVITIDQPNMCWDRYLCVHNKKLENPYRETPWSHTNNRDFEKLDRWKVAGHDADKGLERRIYGGYYGPRGKELLDLLEIRIKDIDETKTDKYLFDKATKYAIKCSESGSSKSLQKQVDNIISVQNDLGYKSNFVKKVDENRKIADEKRAIWEQNKKLYEKQNKPSGFFGMISRLFS